VIELVF